MVKKICVICRKEFESYQTNKKTCSFECYHERQQRKYRKKRKERTKLKKSRYTKEQLGMFQEIADHQQFPEDLMNFKEIKKECRVCRSTKNIVEHHVKYVPIEKKIVMCTKCHSFYHNTILKKKKCTPERAIMRRKQI